MKQARETRRAINRAARKNNREGNWKLLEAFFFFGVEIIHYLVGTFQDVGDVGSIQATRHHLEGKPMNVGTPTRPQNSRAPPSPAITLSSSLILLIVDPKPKTYQIINHLTSSSFTSPSFKSLCCRELYNVGRILKRRHIHPPR